MVSEVEEADVEVLEPEEVECEIVEVEVEGVYLWLWVRLVVERVEREVLGWMGTAKVDRVGDVKEETEPEELWFREKVDRVGDGMPGLPVPLPKLGTLCA